MGNSLRKSPMPPAGTEEAEEAYLDPRSPTPDVIRTPLTGKDNAKQKITKNTDLSKKLENCHIEDKLIHNNPLLSAVFRKHLQSYDPRSPTQDFERTPVTLSANLVETNHDINHNGSVVFPGEEDSNSLDPEVICENAAKNLSEDFLDSTLDDTFQDSEPLGSSTAAQDVIGSEVSPEVPKVLLETDFDYFPSQELHKSKQISLPSNETPIQGDIRNHLKSKFKIIEADPRSPSQGIDRTPIVVHEKEAITPGENVEEMTEESLVAALQSGIADFRRTPAIGTEKALLIYEDAAEHTPRKTQSANKGTRTPLSCVKNKTEERSKSAVSVIGKKMVSRIPKRVGSVPRLQNLQKAMSAELNRSGRKEENTPPPTNRDMWDKDSSVVL